MKVTAKIYISSIIEIGGEKSLIFLISHDDNSLLFFKWKPPFTLQCTIDSHFFIHLNNNNPSFLAATIHISLIIIIISSTSSCEWAAINNNNSRDWDSITIFYISIAPPARFSNEHEMDCVCVCVMWCIMLRWKWHSKPQNFSHYFDSSSTDIVYGMKMFVLCCSRLSSSEWILKWNYW